jgi:hypothetical protein
MTIRIYVSTSSHQADLCYPDLLLPEGDVVEYIDEVDKTVRIGAIPVDTI